VSAPGSIRLHKLLAEGGVASRRGAERLIAAGRVTVNGEVVRERGAHADPVRDVIRVDGRLVARRESRRYVVLHKPAGYLTTRADPRGRPSVFELLPDLGVRLHPVGRLDADAEGVLLFTNDGAVTFRLTHPRHEVDRVYHVLVEGRITADVLARLRRGVVLEDGPARAMGASALRRTGPEGAWLALTLREGRYHEVKRLCLRLGRLAPGQWRELDAAEVRRLGVPATPP
jgi:23S rRNA pseudouridine2605 synthase